MKRVLKGQFCQFLLKSYIQEVESEKITLSGKNKTFRIWQYWDTGINNAPDLVKACVASVDRYCKDYERVLLDDKSIKDYIEIPERVYRLKEKGLISTAHFADIVRTYLLYKYGGCWIDATVYMTAPLPSFIKSSKLFVFQNNKDDDLDNLNMTNYFISSNGNSIIIAKMKRFLEKYWEKNTKAINYFFYAHAFTLFTNSSAENIEEWNGMFKFPFLIVQQMEKELLNKFSYTRLKELERMSPIHKLSYKRRVVAGKKEYELADTLYQHIIDEYINPSDYQGIKDNTQFSVSQRLKSLAGKVFFCQNIDDHLVLKIFGIKFCFKRKEEIKFPSLTEIGILSNKRKRKLIVSLTTYPARINIIHKTITTLLSQTVKPDEVILWLAEEQFPDKNLPETLTRLKDFGLKIEWCEDLKSFKKLIPALKKYPDDIIVTVDDDYYYDKGLLEELYNAYLRNPACIHARQAFVVRKNNAKRFYLKSRNYVYDHTYLPSFLNEPVGCGGVLYPPGALHKNVLNTGQFMQELPTHDDLWFWGHALRNNTKISVLKNGFKLKNIVVEGSQKDSLWQKNMKHSSSETGMSGEKALNRVCNLFPEIVHKLEY